MYEDCTCSLFSFSPSLNNKGDSSYKLEGPFSSQELIESTAEWDAGV